MLKTLKSTLGLAMVVGVMAGCSSNQTAEDTGATMEPEQQSSTPSGMGVESDSGLDSADMTGAEDMADIPTVFYFEFDSAVLDSQARSALLAHAERFRNNSGSIRLTGHADERGSREYNMALGERRANAARDFLVLQGIARNRIETVSYGEERPAVRGSNESAWAQNRRVELQ